MAQYLSAQEAAEELGVSLATLYAYVSRNLIRSEEVGGSKRTRRYSAEDVQQLKDRKEQRRSPEKAVEGALYWGMPVMESAITLIESGHLYYRGMDAIRLATENTFEQVASLIWTGKLDTEMSSHYDQWPDISRARSELAYLSAFEAFQTLLPLAARRDPARYDLRPTAVLRQGIRIMRIMTFIATHIDYSERFDGRIAPQLQWAWVRDQSSASKLIEAALILCADHELNVSTFAARCTASAGATLYDVVVAGLAALNGVKHGGHTRRVEGLLNEIGGVDNVHQALINRLSRGDTIPGFGHQLYPNGDPRGRLLLDIIAETYGGSPTVQLAKAIEAEVFEMLQLHPTIDFALVILARLFYMNDSALTLFALGRTVGWIGHAMEQYQSDTLIRPRARYVGILPLDDE